MSSQINAGQGVDPKPLTAYLHFACQSVSPNPEGKEQVLLSSLLLAYHTHMQDQYGLVSPTC